MFWGGLANFRTKGTDVMNLLVILLLGVVPSELDYKVPYIEINTVYNRDTLDARFTQVLIWDHQNGSKCLHVKQWCMKDKLGGVYKTSDEEYPWTLIFTVDNDRGYVKVRAKRLRVTHTDFDIEEYDRGDFPIEIRRPLWKN